MPEETPPGTNYQKVERPLGKIVINNFVGGISWTLGVLFGTVIIATIAAYFIKRIDVIPILGHFFAKVLESSQQTLQK